MKTAGRPFITSGATSPQLPAQVGDMLFLACFGDNVQAAAGAEFAAGHFGKTAMLLYDRDAEYTTLLARYFKERFVELGGTIVQEGSYTNNGANLSSQMPTVSLTKPIDFYYVAAMPYNVGPVIKQLRDGGYTGPIIGGDGYDDPSWIAPAGASAENVYFTTHALNDGTLGTPAYRKFFAAYKAEFGHDPENAFAALGYDSVYLLADALKHLAISTDPKRLTEMLRETRDFPAVTGAITYGPSHVPQKGVTIIALKGGRYTLAAEVVPQKVPAP